MLEFLMRVREDTLQGRLNMWIGEVNVHIFLGLVEGYWACLTDHGVKDEPFRQFREWLIWEKQEFPVEGWVAKYLRDCNGDHLAAIQKFLGFVAEFVESRKGHTPRHGPT
jgi:hypothetical protein